MATVTVLPDPEHLHTADQAAAALGVPAHVIRRWRRTGKAMPAGLVPSVGRGGKQPLYRLEELRPLAQRYRDTRRAPGH